MKNQNSQTLTQNEQGGENKIESLLATIKNDQDRDLVRDFLASWCEFYEKEEHTIRYGIAKNTIEGIICNSEQLVDAYEFLLESRIELGKYKNDLQIGITDLMRRNPIADQSLADCLSLRQFIDDFEKNQAVFKEKSPIPQAYLIRYLHYQIQSMARLHIAQSGVNFADELDEIDAQDRAEEETLVTADNATLEAIPARGNGQMAMHHDGNDFKGGE
jgi:hypothetical protein